MTGLRTLVATEAKLMLREPGWVFTAGIPLFVLVVFSYIPSSGGLDDAAGTELLASATMAISLALVALYMVPTTLAGYREKGVLRRLSTTPVHPAALLGVQLVLQLILAVASAALLVAVARLAFGVELPRRLPSLLLVFALGAAAMFAIGLLIAAVAPTGQAANGIGVLLYFPSAFLAGLMLPKALMPELLARVGEFTPLGAVRQALQDAWQGTGPEPLLLAIMAGYAVVVGAAAAKLFRWG